MVEWRHTEMDTPWFFMGLQLRQSIESAAMTELP